MIFPFDPAQFGLVAVAVNTIVEAGTVIFTIFEAVQPLASVARIVYAPAVVTG